MKAQVQRAQNLLDRKNPKPIEALAQLKPLLKSPDAPWPIFHFAGVAYALLNDHERCEKMMRKALEAGSTEPESFHTLSVALYKLENYAEAESFARQAVAMRPDFMKALLNLGQVLQSQARLEEALQVYARANQLDPRNAVIAFKIGSIYQNLGNFDKAKELFEIAAQMDPTYDAPVIERASSLIKTRDFEAGEALLKEFLVRKPNSVEARSLLADSKKDQSLYDEAIALYKGVLDDNPRIPGVRVNYGLCLQEMGRYDEAEKEYLRALEYPPTMMEAMSNYLMVMHYNPERTREYIFEAHKKWDAFFAPAERPERPVPADHSPDRRLRVGFVSGGFRSHPVGWMITRGLEELPADQFEIYCYTTNNINDKITQRIATRADKWRSVVGFNDAVVANMIREDEIDILVELSGHAGDNRLRAVAMEPAPVIMKWVGGLFNSTGLQSVDYLLSDWHETPEGVEEFYTEKLVRMPDDYICFMPPSYAPDVTALPALENGFVTFGCFNNPSKINPELLGQWARLLARVPGSKLFLKSGQYDSVEFQGRVLAALADAGIDADRVLFEGRSPHEDLLGAYGRVDIALDPWPYSGGLSTCEALWMGVPVVTYPGPTFAGRHSVTHLHNSGLGELVADSWDAYVDIATGLAGDLDTLAGLRARLRDQVAASPLCDGERFGAALSLAFRKVWHAYVDDKLKQDHIAVSLDGVSGESMSGPTSSTQPKSIKKERISIYPEVASDETQSRNSELPKASDVGRSKAQSTSLITNDTVEETQKNRNPDTVSPFSWVDTFEVELPSKVVVVLPETDEVLTSYVFKETGKWIDPEIDILVNLVKSGDTVVDVGAGFGVYSLPLAKLVGQQGHVYAIEPQSAVRSYLENSKQVNDFTNVTVCTDLIGVDNEEVEWQFGQTPEFSVVFPQSGSQTAISLDSWWKSKGFPHIDLLKVDVGATELKMLSTSVELLESCNPRLILSTPDSFSTLLQVKSFLEDHGYQLFHWVEGIEQLVELESVDQVDSFTLNIIALHANTVAELTESGMIFSRDHDAITIRGDEWESWFQQMPWTNEFMSEWLNQAENPVNASYYEVLSLVAAASKRKESLSKRSTIWLDATRKMIAIFNDGNASLSEKLTLCFLLNKIGKREKAVEVLLSVLNETQFGSTPIAVSKPFVLPISDLSYRPILTEFPKWMMVRLLESWLLLKDITAFASGSMEQKIRKVLEGNPEMELPGRDEGASPVGHEVPVFVHVLFNNIHTQSAINTFERLNAGFNDMKHVCFLEASRSINGFDVDVRGKSNIVVFQAKRDLDSIIQAIESLNPTGVVYHGLFFDWQYKILDTLSSDIRQYWVMWGGDLYNPIRTGNIRRSSIAKISGVLTDVQGDRTLFDEVYGSRLELPSFGYGAEIQCSDDIPFDLRDRIIIGNSGDVSNHHIDILKNIVSKEDWSSYKYYMPFSYNATNEYAQLVENTIQKLGMGDVVTLNTSFMPIELYNGMLKHSKLLVLAHQRQQAHGSIKVQLLSRNPVVLRKHITIDGRSIVNPSWKFFSDGGFSLVDYDSFESVKSLRGLIEGYQSSDPVAQEGQFLSTSSDDYLAYIRKPFMEIARIKKESVKEAI